jgi:hypothetical protein
MWYQLYVSKTYNTNSTLHMYYNAQTQSEVQHCRYQTVPTEGYQQLERKGFVNISAV